MQRSVAYASLPASTTFFDSQIQAIAPRHGTAFPASSRSALNPGNRGRRIHIETENLHNARILYCGRIASNFLSYWYMTLFSYNQIIAN